MIGFLSIFLAILLGISQDRAPEQHPVFEMAKDRTSITINSTASDTRVVFSSPEFHESGEGTLPWEAGWTKVEVLRLGQKLLCLDGRKYDPPMGYSPVFDGGRGFSPDGRYLTIFVYNTVARTGSDGKGYFTFLDLQGCRKITFQSLRFFANPLGGYWKPGDPHTYMIHRGGKWQETYPEPAEPKSGVTQK